MKKFLKLNENNVVEIIFSEDDVKDFLPEEENLPDDIIVFYLRINFGYDSIWKIVDENEICNLKVGYLYFENLNKCIPYDQPFPSWSLNSELGEWESPVQKPIDNSCHYVWNEDEQEWGLFISEK